MSRYVKNMLTGEITERTQNPGGENPPSEPAHAAGPAPTPRVTAAQAAGELVEQKIGRLEREAAELRQQLARHEATIAAGVRENTDLRRQLAVHNNDCPTFSAFWEKYAIGPKSAPSCLMCGASMQGKEQAITHLELPGIVICAECHALRTERENARVPIGWRRWENSGVGITDGWWTTRYMTARPAGNGWKPVYAAPQPAGGKWIRLDDRPIAWLMMDEDERQYAVFSDPHDADAIAVYLPAAAPEKP